MSIAPVEIPVALCVPSPTARPVQPVKVEILKRSIAEVGLRQPINVRVLGDKFEIRGGGHRHAAYVDLGRMTIPAFVREDDDLHAELAEIDENLVRNELTTAERDLAIARRKAIYEELHPETVNGATGRGRPKNSFANDGEPIQVAERFTKATASDVGLAERTIQRSVSRVESLGSETVAKIVGSSLDRGDEMDALAKLPEDQRSKLVERAAAGEQVTAKGEKDILAKAKEIRARDRKERFERVTENLARISDSNAPLPTGRKYPVIYADPATRFVSGFDDRSIENHYPTMPLDELLGLPVSELATDAAVLFIWTTIPQMRNTMRMIEAYGFDYVSAWCWDKEVHGTGYWGFNQHEELLIATRGGFPAPIPGTQPRSLYRERKTDHSVKPAWFAEQIERIYPNLPKIELFTRNARPGWDVWGNQSSANSPDGASDVLSRGGDSPQKNESDTAEHDTQYPPTSGDLMGSTAEPMHEEGSGDLVGCVLLERSRSVTAGETALFTSISTACCSRDEWPLGAVVPLPDDFRLDGPAPVPTKDACQPARASDDLDIPAFLRRRADNSLPSSEAAHDAA